MWTGENRGRYDRSKLRYPSDLTDEEWSHVERLLPPEKHGGAKRTVNLREVGQRSALRSQHRLPVAGDPERSAAQEHGLRLFRPVGLGRDARLHPCDTLRQMS